MMIRKPFKRVERKIINIRLMNRLNKFLWNSFLQLICILFFFLLIFILRVNDQLSQIFLSNYNFFLILRWVFKEQILAFFCSLLLLAVFYMVKSCLINNAWRIMITVWILKWWIFLCICHRSSFILWVHVIWNIWVNSWSHFDMISAAYWESKTLKIQNPRFDSLFGFVLQFLLTRTLHWVVFAFSLYWRLTEKLLILWLDHWFKKVFDAIRFFSSFFWSFSFHTRNSDWILNFSCFFLVKFNHSLVFRVSVWKCLSDNHWSKVIFWKGWRFTFFKVGILKKSSLLRS